MIVFWFKLLTICAVTFTIMVDCKPLHTLDTTMILKRENSPHEVDVLDAESDSYYSMNHTNYYKRAVPFLSKDQKDIFLTKWLGIPHQPKLNVGVLLGNNLDTFDLTQATRMFSFIPGANILTIAESSNPITTQEGVNIIPDHTFNDNLDLDLLVMVAGIGPDPAISAYLRRVGPTVKKYIVSICEGAMVLAASGLLDGKKATATKSLWPMTSLFPLVKWVKKARFTHDGNIITTSGAAAGLDGVFYIIQLLYGEEVAHKLATVNEYEWNPDPNHDLFTDIDKDFPFIPNLLFPSFSSFSMNVPRFSTNIQ
ncbi:uncharacterized protein VTP21DRAFT_5809 [Calcarisporiella thermophila]|uniref:uncharacterized protein n=1 Tax=Calcarisporiella thermophila TaxID=911321 RepID=UPI003741F9B5